MGIEVDRVFYAAIAVLFLEYLYQCYDKRFLANPEEAVCTFGRPVSR